MCFWTKPCTAQLTTNAAMTPVQLVQNVLLGPGITASGISYTGDPASRGYFDGSASNIGFSSGVILSSGDISDAEGPNDSPGSFGTGSLPGDPDLDIIMSVSSYDAAILEFDFIPTSDTIKFRYVFGSEEYMEYVGGGSNINDGFGFFISGPGISGPFTNGAMNIALIPGTSLPVTMNNLNLFNNSAYYFDNGNGLGSGTAPDGTTVQYDGFSVPLTATAIVQCGQTYHIKLAVADGFDHVIDSGVFLEEGSFASTGHVVITPSTGSGGFPGMNDTTIYEGCGSASIVFDRGITNLSNPDTVVLYYGGTATNGVDYSFVNDTLFYAPGQDSLLLTINSLRDSNIEGTESVSMTMYTSTPCRGKDTTVLHILILDTPPLTLTLSSDTLLNCPAKNLVLSASTTGGVGVGNYSYVWSGSASIVDTAQVSTSVTTTYYATVDDHCGNTAGDSVTVSIVPYSPLSMTFSNDASICERTSIFLNATVSNGRPGYTYSWTPAVSASDSVTVAPPATTTYSLTVTDACGLSTSDQATITIIPADADFTYGFTSNQMAHFTDISTDAVYWLWNFGDSSYDSSSVEKNPAHEYATDGTYTVSLITVNSLGCTDTIQHTIIVEPDFHFFFPNSFSPNKNGVNDVYMGYGVGISSFHMHIYDRWGELLFSSDDPAKGWDGTYKGHAMPAGIYICVFDLKGNLHETKKYITNVNLIR